ncbi:FecR domain-containing protein [Pseudoduganella namucuonensis]|nr:FecR domain-containing protein [Pseudoduganella namucuonensis]
MLRQLLAVAGFALAAHTVQAAEAGRIIYVAGSAQVADRAATLNAPVQEGEMLVTGKDGFIYIKTADDGLFILRPSTKARIAAYYIDKQNPANTRIKLELLSGVARSKSGEAVKLARQNFRFNTPVAAIGVRGTDFTVFTDQDTSRVTVLTGGITISGFDGACRPEGGGPCEGAAARELFATQKGQLLQIRRGQPAPQMLPETNAVSPDAVAPPRPDEPGKSPATTLLPPPQAPSLDAQKTNTLKQQLGSNQEPGDGGNVVTPEQPGVPTDPIVTVPPVTETGPLPTEPTKPVDPKPADPVKVVPDRGIVWGRWQPVLDQAAAVDLVAELNKGSELVAQNSYYALFRTQGKEYLVPERGGVSFELSGGSAVIRDDNTAIANRLASVENGVLKFNFDNRTFATNFDLVNQSERLLMQSTGKVSSDGRFVGDPLYVQPNNMSVSGFISLENSGTAAYLFDSRLSGGRTVYGATSWNKPK